MRQLTERGARQAVDDHFSQLGAHYEEAAFGSSGQRWISERELEGVWEALRGLAPGSRVLDAGAGNGRFTRLLSERGALSVTALDAVLEMLVTVRERVPSAAPVLARLGEPLALRHDAFDAVVAMRVLKWVPAWEDAIAELCRVLAPGGILVVDVANRRSVARFGYRGAPITLRTLDEVRRIGGRHGIRWTGVHAGTHLPHPCWDAAGDGVGLAVLKRLQGVADRLLGAHGARSLVVVGRKGPG